MPVIRGHGGDPGPFVTVALTDTGSGIALDDQVRIFEPFCTAREIGKGRGSCRFRHARLFTKSRQRYG
ncbi:hypothetical protein [Sphingomonas carotinifaciens]|nr:hypothetical protein [Sphingomonas carotinifaciens]